MITFNGSITNYVKGLAAQAEAEKKMYGGGQKKSAVSVVTAAQPKTTGSSKYNIGIIEQKLESGQSLTGGELEYLRKNYTDLYQKAIRIAQEREAYEKQLENCETKEDIYRLQIMKAHELRADLKAAGKDLGKIKFIQMRSMAINKTHASFVNSAEYKKLARDHTELAERREKRDKFLAEAEDKRTEAAGQEQSDVQEGAEPDNEAKPAADAEPVGIAGETASGGETPEPSGEGLTDAGPSKGRRPAGPPSHMKKNNG